MLSYGSGAAGTRAATHSHDSQPSPALRSPSSTRETGPVPGSWEYVRTEEGAQGKGGDGGLASEGGTRTTGSSTRHYQVPLPALDWPAGEQLSLTGAPTGGHA